MMQIGGVDNLVLKDVKLPDQNDPNEKKVRFEEQDSKIKEDQAAERERDAAEKVQKNEKAEETERSVYGDVVGRSSDGDTTRVKAGAMEALETGMVFAKDEKENNLMEFNRDQLKIMVERSDITENRYNHEITRRDELMEKDDKSAFAKSNAEMIEKQREEAEKKAQEKARERLDEMQGKTSGTNEMLKTDEASATTEASKANETTDTKEGSAANAAAVTNDNTQRLENGMNTLAGAVKGLEIEEEGVLNAAQNGRSEIIDQILNPEEGNLKVIIK